MSRNATKPGLTAAMTAGRALLAAGWRYDSTSPMANDTTIRTLLHPTGREIHARTVDGGELTDLTMTGLSLEQVAGAIDGAGLGVPAEPEHRHVGGSAGGHGENSAECACGVTYAGFDTHAEVSALMDRHIAQPEAADACRHCNGAGMDSTRHLDVVEDHPCGYCGGSGRENPGTGPNAELVAGLRALADFIEANPTMPALTYPKLLDTGPVRESDADGVKRVRLMADLLGVEVVKSLSGGHLRADRQFAGLAFSAAHVPAESSARHEAHMSYADNVQPAGGVS